MASLPCSWQEQVEEQLEPEAEVEAEVAYEETAPLEVCAWPISVSALKTCFQGAFSLNQGHGIEWLGGEERLVRRPKISAKS